MEDTLIILLLREILRINNHCLECTGLIWTIWVVNT